MEILNIREQNILKNGQIKTSLWARGYAVEWQIESCDYQTIKKIRGRSRKEIKNRSANSI